MAVFLPKINFMEVEGFNKIFKEEKVFIDFSKSLNILLGGNGLGKTTLLQCIVYALTGGTNSPEIETYKAYRWDNSFFKRRVNPDRLGTANIVINFNIDNVQFVVKRVLTAPKYLNFHKW
jgi:recombinational DNA repair ATPase RecF